MTEIHQTFFRITEYGYKNIDHRTHDYETARGFYKDELDSHRTKHIKTDH